MNCPRCEIGDHGTTKRKDGLRHTPTVEEPDMDTLEAWMFDGDCEATDGCVVDPDGRCLHGHSSWLILMGLI